MSKKIWFYSLFFLVLILAFYFMLTKLIPGFGKQGLPLINKVQPFSFLDQNGDRITNKDVEGKVYVAEFFFTTCHGICPKLNTNLMSVYKKYKNEEDFKILSHTVDPTTDSVGEVKTLCRFAGCKCTRMDISDWVKRFFIPGRKTKLSPR